MKVCPGRKVKMFARVDGFSAEGHGYGEGVAIAEIVSGSFDIRMTGGSIATTPLPPFVPTPLPEEGEKLARDVEGYLMPLLEQLCHAVP